MVFSLFPTKNFPNEITALIFTIVFIIILLFELRILLRNKNSKEDKSSLLLILFGIFIPLTSTIILSFTNLGSINPKISYIGLTLLLFGFFLRQHSISVLGKFFLPVVKKQKNQKIIQEGPYKYIRHPSYTGLFLEILGVSLALSNWISSLIVIILFLPIISYRIKVEEKFLSKNFKDYSSYQKRTKKLIPFIY